jgi:2-polyprenyl-3-methyl-5-hydroxy-6-metoxy-1,4-benzoquinol methylase
VFAQKIPTAAELEKHYEGYGRNDYLSPITIKRYEELLDQLEPYRKTNNLIDVGCGIGYFLEVAKRRGWNAYGTEYTDRAVEICESKGISMKKGELNPENYPDGFFDIITSFEVIEHINNPREELSRFKKILRAGGAIYITTPNFNSLLRYVLKQSYSVITYPEHLSYYSPKTFNKIFADNGFQKKWIKTTGISITLLLSGLRKKRTQHIAENTADESIRRQLDSGNGMQKLKNLINFSLTVLGIGDSLKGLFVKK